MGCQITFGILKECSKKTQKTIIIILEKKHIDSLNSIEIDSLKIRIPLHLVEILDSNIIDKYVSINYNSGELDEEPKVRNWLLKDFKGYSTRWQIRDFKLEKGRSRKFLTILLNSKILEENYFNGISKNNIENVYDKLIKMNVAHFSYNSFLGSECTDIDFKKDIHNSYFIESIPVLVSHAKPSHLSGRGVRPFKKKDNMGIQWSDRKGATLQNPYLKMYHKSIELNNKSTEFKDEYLRDLDVSNIIRVEFTIKSMKHLRKFDINSQKLIDLLNLSQETKSIMLHNIVNTHLMSRKIKAEKPIGKISPTDVMLYNALDIISKRTYMNKNMIIDSMLENFKSKTAKSRGKKRLNNIWDTYVQMQEHTKKKEKMITLFDAICW